MSLGSMRSTFSTFCLFTTVLLVNCLAAARRGGRSMTKNEFSRSDPGCGTSNETLCPGGSSNPEGVCCLNNQESCCPDRINGGVCCLEELTMCCPANVTDDLPSRCCPRWYICCTKAAGRYGCCNPALGDPRRMPSNPIGRGVAAGSTAYALFDEVSLLTDEEDLWALSLSLPSGDYEQKKVANFNTYGEMGRRLPFSRSPSAGSSGVFYLLQAELQGVHPSRRIHLQIVDPAAATVKQITVINHVSEPPPSGPVLDFYNIDGVGIVFTTPSPSALASSNATSGCFSGRHRAVSRETAERDCAGVAAFQLWLLDVTSGKATFLGSTSPSDPFAGYFLAASVSRSRKEIQLFRVGPKDPATGSGGYGVAIVSVALPTFDSSSNSQSLPVFSGEKSAASVDWVSVHIPTGFTTFLGGTLMNFTDSAMTFISLAPSAEDGYLSVFTWTIDAVRRASTAPVLVVALGNAGQADYFGLLVETVCPGRAASGGPLYAAIVKRTEPGSPYTDLWAVVTVDVQARVASNDVLAPWLLANTNNPVGLGIM